MPTPAETSESELPSAVLERPLTLERLELRLVVLPQVEPFRSAVGVRRERRALFVRWHDADGAWGIGECSCRPDPFFSGEFVAGAWRVLTDYAAPLLPRRGSLADAAAALARIRGWNFTTAAVLDAACDLLRRRGEPDLLDCWPQPRTPRVPIGISLGLFDSAPAAVERVRRAVGEGYRRVKLKIAPAMDRAPLAAIRDAFPDLHLAFDANGSCGAADLGFVAALAELAPAAVEQPFAPGRLDLAADLKRRRPGLRICLDESITDLGLLAAAHRLGALDELNVKPGRLGGPLETFRVLGFCRRHAIPAWVGGMFETGVGRWANLRVASRLPEATAHDLSPSRRYFPVDVVAAPVEMAADGTIDLADDSPVELDEAELDRLTEERVDVSI